MMKMKIDPYYISIGIIYLVISYVIYPNQGFFMSVFLFLIALFFILFSFLNKKNEREPSKFVLFSYVFVIFSMLFPFSVSIYKGDIREAIFVFLFGIIFFICYLRELNLLKNYKEVKQNGK